MQIIASNKMAEKDKPKIHWKPYALTAGCILTLAIGIAIATGAPQYGFIGLFVALVVMVVGFSFGNNFRKTPFCAYTDGTSLYVDYIQINDLYRPQRFHAIAGPPWERKQYSFPIKQIIGYKLHTFFRQPSVLDIQLDEGNYRILDIVIKIDSLSRKEAGKLILFLEGIIPHHVRTQQKRLHGSRR